MSQLISNDNLVQELKSLIETTKANVAISVNSSLTLLYWNIGKIIEENILKSRR